MHALIAVKDVLGQTSRTGTRPPKSHNTYFPGPLLVPIAKLAWPTRYAWHAGL